MTYIAIIAVAETAEPSIEPTFEPTYFPSLIQTDFPSYIPTHRPTVKPTTYTPTQEFELCPEPDTKFYNINGSCYFLNHTLVNFFLANQTCISLGGHLADIHSSNEQNSIWEFVVSQFYSTSKLSNEGPYIGYYARPNSMVGSGAFLWTTHTSRTDFTNWAKNSPAVSNSEYGACASIGQYGYWVDSSCAAKRTFLCEKSLNKRKRFHFFGMSFEQQRALLTSLLIAIPLFFIFLCYACIRNKPRSFKDIRLKIPKLNLPFSKKKPFSFHERFDSCDQIQFNCFGPDYESEHDILPPIRSSKSTPERVFL